jgi:hypothetical protein
MLLEHELAVTVLDVSFHHVWIDVDEDVLQEIGGFREVMVQHLGSDIGIFDDGRFLVFDVREALG